MIMNDRKALTLTGATLALIFAAGSPSAQVTCTTEVFAGASSQLPDEIPVANGSAAEFMATVLGCELPEFVSQEVPVMFRGGEDAGKLVGFFAGAIDGRVDDGYWVVADESNILNIAVPAMTANLNRGIENEIALQLDQPLDMGIDDVKGFAIGSDILGDLLSSGSGYSGSAQLVAVSAGLWPSDRYMVTFLSEPNGGVVHRGSVIKSATEWSAVIKSSSLPSYSIISSDDEVCNYEDAEVSTNDSTQSATFFCRFQP